MKDPKFAILMYDSDVDIDFGEASEDQVKIHKFDNWPEMASFVKSVYESSQKALESKNKIITLDKNIVIPKR